MKQSLSTVAFALSLFTSASFAAEKQGITFHKPISWEKPLDTLDFENWDLRESSVILENKIILAPTGKD